MSRSSSTTRISQGSGASDSSGPVGSTDHNTASSSRLAFGGPLMRDNSAGLGGAYGKRVRQRNVRRLSATWPRMNPSFDRRQSHSKKTRERAFLPNTLCNKSMLQNDAPVQSLQRPPIKAKSLASRLSVGISPKVFAIIGTAGHTFCICGCFDKNYLSFCWSFPWSIHPRV